MEKEGYIPYIILIAWILIKVFSSKYHKKGSGNAEAIDNYANLHNNIDVDDIDDYMDDDDDDDDDYDDDDYDELSKELDNTNKTSNIHRLRVQELQKKSYKFTAKNEARSRSTMDEISDENIYNQDTPTVTTEDIDWKKAVIASEVLNKKY